MQLRRLRSEGGTMRKLFQLITSLGLCGLCALGLGAEPFVAARLDWEGDIASRLVDAADAFLLRELDRATERRDAAWNPGPEGRDAMLAAHRARLAYILGMRDERVPVEMEYLQTTENNAYLGGSEGDEHFFNAYRVRWPVLEGVTAEGLLIDPATSPLADVVLLPDADQSPEMLAGLTPGIAVESQLARSLARNGCRVLVPALISRHREPRGGRAVLTHREYLYRPAFVLGRHLIGFELQKALAGVDFFEKERKERAANATDNRPIAVAGYGEGGMLALYAAALDDRLDAALVSGYFDDRRTIWQQPIDRNIFGLLERFGDAELAAMIAPRSCVIEAAKGPELTIPGEGGAPAELASPRLESMSREVERAKTLAQRLHGDSASISLVTSGESGQGPAGSAEALRRFLKALGIENDLRSAGLDPRAEMQIDHEARLRRQIVEIDRFTQRLLEESPYIRAEFMQGLDTSSVEAYQRSVEPYREMFRNEIIGAFDHVLVELNPRARLLYDEPAWTGHEVVLDVFEGFFAYGILLVPKDLQEGERRPVVVCQHGLEGRPQQTMTGDHPAYHDFAAKLAERGFVVFAPQHLYIFGDRFRTLQRKANPLGKTLFSLMVPQHEQLLRWLKTLSFVDGDRIAFYGLSYGGKSAMRIPPLVDGYALSICSADFNDWVWKNASTRAPYSYVWTGEYEIFEFDLGSTFNYAEMAALIAPRPFMVERGHFDGVAPDERVAYEYAKVRHLYAARLKRPDLTEIEFFDGPHTIHGVGTFSFLERWLGFPAQRARDEAEPRSESPATPMETD
jgi:dienelactone hydrolase